MLFSQTKTVMMESEWAGSYWCAALPMIYKLFLAWQSSMSMSLADGASASVTHSSEKRGGYSKAKSTNLHSVKNAPARGSPFFHFITMPIKYYIFSGGTPMRTLLLADGADSQKCRATKSVDIYICPPRSPLFPFPFFNVCCACTK